MLLLAGCANIRHVRGPGGALMTADTYEAQCRAAETFAG